MTPAEPIDSGAGATAEEPQASGPGVFLGDLLGWLIGMRLLQGRHQPKIRDLIAAVHDKWPENSGPVPGDAEIQQRLALMEGISGAVRVDGPADRRWVSLTEDGKAWAKQAKEVLESLQAGQ